MCSMMMTKEKKMFSTDHCCQNEHCDEMMETEVIQVMIPYPLERKRVMTMMNLEMVVDLKDRHSSA